MHTDSFPKGLTISGDNYTMRLATPDDRDRLFALAQTLPENDLLFMRRDITQMDAIDEWMQDIARGHAITILVEANDEIVAYGTLYYNQIFWHRHIGELRFLVSSAYRNRGLGTRISRELLLCARDLNLEKAITYMAVDDRGARRLLEDMGFSAEAMLTDWVKTRDEKTHDLLIMSLAMGELMS